MAIYDEFKGQLTPGIFSLLEANQVFVVKVPPNCTDCLQPMDLSLNKAVKEFLRKNFKIGTLVRSKAFVTQMKVSLPWIYRLKPLGVDWLVKAHQYLQNNTSLAKNGFCAAGITSALAL